MAQDNRGKVFDPRYMSSQKVGGFDTANLLSGDRFLSSKANKTQLSFSIKDIVEFDDSEILKLDFPNNIVVRIMKYSDEQNRAASTFDIVDESKKQIVMKADKDFIGGLGIAELFFDMQMITQWEIPILTKLSRAFVLGDPEAIKNLIMSFHLKINRENEWRLKMKLGFD